ncbi:MFS transporter [Nocardia carnea]|uniref:MFS transporter n=1 Tax=Nocardia carnea TaxID=37328 RepID=UPI00245809F8|nr:MFS transporter [Nocardia carnea]
MTHSPGFAAPGQRVRRGKNLALLTASSAMDNAEANVTSVLFPLMREALGLSTSALGTIVAVGKAVGVFAGVPWVMLANRYSRRTVLAICAGFWGVWSIAAGMSGSFAQFVVLYGIAAAGFAGAGPIALAILSDIYPDSRRGRATGALYGGVALITGISGPVFGQLSGFADGWRYGFYLSGGITLVLGVLILVSLDDPVSRSRHEVEEVPTLDRIEDKARNLRGALRELFAIRTYRYLLVQRVFSGQNIIMSFATTFMVTERGLSTATAAAIVLPFALGYMAGTFTGGRINDLWHRHRPRTGRVAMLQVSQLAFAAVAFAAIQPVWGNTAIYVLLFTVLGFLQGQVPVTNRPLIMAVVPPHLRGMAFAVSVSTVEALAYAGYALLAGFLGDLIGLQATLLLITVALTTANGVCSAALYRPYAHDSAVITARWPEPPAGLSKSAPVTAAD